MVVDMDILKELTLDELIQMQEVCKRNFPKAIRAHHHLYNFTRWVRLYNTDELRDQYILSDKCRVKFYGHRNGDINNCTHFGISGEKDYCIFAFTLQESCEEFRECLLKTKRIKWELKPLFISTEVQHLKELHRIFMVDVFFYIPNYMFFMPKEKALKLEWTCTLKMVVDKDILKELTLEELTQMQEICKQNLPKAIRGHHYLYNFTRWARLYNSAEHQRELITSDKCRVKFYGHRNGDISNCTYIAITAEKDYSIFAFTLQESCDEYRECLQRTRLIKWELKPLLVSMEVDHLKEIHRVFKLDALFYVPNFILYMSKENALKLNWSVPDDVYIGELNFNHVRQINDVWPHKYPGSDDFIATFIKANKGLGIFTKNENKLLSWVLINDNFCPGFLQTVDEAKRKGYAEILTKALLRYIAEEYNLDSTLFTIKTNTPGINLYKKIGLEIINSCAWVKIDTVSKLT